MTSGCVQSASRRSAPVLFSVDVSLHWAVRSLTQSPVLLLQEEGGRCKNTEVHHGTLISAEMNRWRLNIWTDTFTKITWHICKWRPYFYIFSQFQDVASQNTKHYRDNFQCHICITLDNEKNWWHNGKLMLLFRRLKTYSSHIVAVCISLIILKFPSCIHILKGTCIPNKVRKLEMYGIDSTNVELVFTNGYVTEKVF